MPPIDWMKFLQIFIASLNDCLNPDVSFAEAQEYAKERPWLTRRRIAQSLRDHRLRAWSPENCDCCYKVLTRAPEDVLEQLASGALSAPPREYTE
jgi:hypothetical protein